MWSSTVFRLVLGVWRLTLKKIMSKKVGIILDNLFIALDIII